MCTTGFLFAKPQLLSKNDFTCIYIYIFEKSTNSSKHPPQEAIDHVFNHGLSHLQVCYIPLGKEDTTQLYIYTIFLFERTTIENKNTQKHTKHSGVYLQSRVSFGSLEASAMAHVTRHALSTLRCQTSSPHLSLARKFFFMRLEFIAHQ